MFDCAREVFEWFFSKHFLKIYDKHFETGRCMHYIRTSSKHNLHMYLIQMRLIVISQKNGAEKKNRELSSKIKALQFELDQTKGVTSEIEKKDKVRVVFCKMICN